jgi:hypothetical protein
MTEPAATATPVTYKQEALMALQDWQAEVAADRGVNPTEANATELYQINLVINQLEAI